MINLVDQTFSIGQDMVCSAFSAHLVGVVSFAVIFKVLLIYQKASVVLEVIGTSTLQTGGAVLVNEATDNSSRISNTRKTISTCVITCFTRLTQIGLGLIDSAFVNESLSQDTLIVGQVVILLALETF